MARGRFVVELPRGKGQQGIYVNWIMQEKRRFEAAQAVEVFVEVVETLHTNGFTKTGMQDAGNARRDLPRFCAVGNVKK